MTADRDADVTIDQVGCARCLGDGHPALTFRRLQSPVELGGHTLTHWAPCPTNGEPILLEIRETGLQPVTAPEKVDWRPTRIAETLNRLPMVVWDRMIDSPVDEIHRIVVVYGWIGRPDGRSDFVVLGFASWSEIVEVTTSSALYSAEMTRLVNGEGSDHFDCRRVEDVLGALVERRVEI